MARLRQQPEHLGSALGANPGGVWSMRIVIIVAPHERKEALDTYRDRLTPADIEMLMTTPDDATVRLMLGKPIKAKG
jgi:hypothetical protein